MVVSPRAIVTVPFLFNEANTARISPKSGSLADWLTARRAVTPFSQPVDRRHSLLSISPHQAVIRHVKPSITSLSRRSPHEPKLMVSYLQTLKSSEESLREQLEKAKKKEAAFIVTVAKQEQEISKLKVALITRSYWTEVVWFIFLALGCLLRPLTTEHVG
ncbi:hypothetical protein LguiA_018188 [Lonicera macranthoides]